MSRFFFVLFFSMSLSLALAQETYHVVLPTANVYDYPGASGKLITQLRMGQEVQYLKTMEDGSYEKVQVKGKLGYMEVGSIKKGKSQLKNKVADRKKYHVSVYETHIHEKKSLQSKKLATLKEEKIVEVLETDGEWARVQNGSSLGYVFLSHLKEGKPAPKKNKTKAKKSVNYITLYDTKAYSAQSNSSAVIKSFGPKETVAVEDVVDGKWAKVRMAKGYGYIPMRTLKKQPKPKSTGKGGGVNVNKIGTSKNPKKVGAVCRDGSTDYKVGPNTCSKGNGVAIWIYTAPK